MLVTYQQSQLEEKLKGNVESVNLPLQGLGTDCHDQKGEQKKKRSELMMMIIFF